MSWTAQQKAAAREELLTQILPETSTHYRTSFLKAVFVVTACFLLTALGFSNLGNDQNNWLQGNSVLIGTAGLTCMIFAAVVAYTRFVDWRHRLEIEGKIPEHAYHY